MADDPKPPGMWDQIKAAPLWAKSLMTIGLLVVVVVAAVPASEDNGDGGGGEATTEAVATEAETTTATSETSEPETTTAPPETSEPETAEPEPTEEDLRAALDDADPTGFGAVATDLNVKQLETAADNLLITLETPEGGFEGASENDLDGSAAAVFEAVYVDAGWQGDATVQFTGGLVNTRTGRDLPNERTGLYRLTAKQAQRINWDDAELIDWSVYREFAHPALKD